jgi:uncharacterized OB-fold protein
MSDVPDALRGDVWQRAARLGHLEATRCSRCRVWAWPPSTPCRSCGAETVWEPVSTEGIVYAISVVHRQASTSPANSAAIVVACIDIEDGPRILTQVIGDASTGTAIGDRVTIELGRLSDDGPVLPLARATA